MDSVGVKKGAKINSSVMLCVFTNEGYTSSSKYFYKATFKTDQSKLVVQDIQNSFAIYKTQIRSAAFQKISEQEIYTKIPSACLKDHLFYDVDIPINTYPNYFMNNYFDVYDMSGNYIDDKSTYSYYGNGDYCFMLFKNSYYKETDVKVYVYNDCKSDGSGVQKEFLFPRSTLVSRTLKEMGVSTLYQEVFDVNGSVVQPLPSVSKDTDVLILNNGVANFYLNNTYTQVCGIR